MPMEAGSVSLKLQLNDKNIGQQVQAAAATTEKAATAAFSGTGTAAAKAIGEPIKKASGGTVAAIKRDCLDALAAYSHARQSGRQGNRRPFQTQSCAAGCRRECRRLAGGGRRDGTAQSEAGYHQRQAG